MNEKKHLKDVNKYYVTSKLGYNFFLWGSKHFGYYPKNKNISERKAQALMQDLVAEKLKLSSKDKVLDAGCGQGVVGTYLAKKYNADITGITIVPFEVEKANKLSKIKNVKKIARFYLMDYNNIKFNKNSFDCIYCMESLSHSLNIKKTFQELYKVLKKNGRIAIFDYELSEEDHFSTYEKEVLSKIIKGSAMYGLSKQRTGVFYQTLKEVGFKNIHVEDITENLEPSLKRLYRFSFISYYLFVKPFKLQTKYPNIAAAAEFYNQAKKGLIKYKIFTATK
jgi:cyclopropane fatty-acyl-phospholipid synthase-like methyltransferase